MRLAPRSPRAPLRAPLLLFGFAGLLLAACGEDGKDTPDMQGTPDMATATTPMPMDYYNGRASAALGSATNQAPCATCHSNDGSPRSGNTFKDIAYLTSYKGGDAATLLDAANACVTGWMGGTALKEGDAAWTGLRTYLQSISDRARTTPNQIAPEVLADQAAYETAYRGGDAQAGAAKYTRACGVCHDSGLRVNAAASLPKAALKNFPIGRIAQKVRTSGPPPSGMRDANDSTPGPMPFFEPGELSIADLRDIIAHVKQ